MLALEFVRREKRLTQAQVAALARLSQSDIGRAESGRWLPNADQLERIGRALGISPRAVLREVIVTIDPPADLSEPTEGAE